ncbi:hypothetical protein [Brevibacterium otitidis]|uniref:Uncharacterized protein n=1 Tax=Brevibacterium otitidis TaxID=53364 RepID=A0ABV5X120_9MICO|nr:hypothetical protein GCM10023233_04680 [Brevibacterium otitidis]
MSEYTYTAEDFAEAEFAIDPSEAHPLARRWVRFYADDDFPWKNGHGAWRTSEDMATESCIPVYAEPYSPEALKRAWEHGETGKTRKGDTIAWEMSNGGLATAVVNGETLLNRGERIIYRAPEPDPVADLTAVLHGWHDHFQPKELAEFLHKHGVKVVTDNE